VRERDRERVFCTRGESKKAREREIKRERERDKERDKERERESFVRVDI
jgi:hypothetical protein